MTLALDPKILAGVQATLARIPDKANKIPVCDMYLFTPAGGAIEITATDCDIELTLTIDGAAGFAPACLPPYIVEAAAAVPASAVRLDVDPRTATFSAGRARYAAPVLPGGDFPRLKPTFTDAADIDGKALAAILQGAAPAAMPKGSARHYLEGVYLHAADGRLRAVATNGHRFQLASTGFAGAGPGRGIIIPTKSVGEIAGLADRAGGPVRVETCEWAVAVSAGRERIVSKLVEGVYPDYPRVIPEPTGVAAGFDVAEMLAALGRVLKVQDSAGAGEPGKPKKSDPSGAAIRLRQDGDDLVVEAAHRGEAIDAVRAEFEGAFPTIGLSGRYLHATLGSMKDRGSDTARMDVRDNATAIRLESPTDEDFLAIVMPMRV